MWKGARGRVTPDPWGDDPIEVEEVPMHPPAYSDWGDPMPEPVPVKQKKSEPKVKKSKEKVKVESQSNGEVNRENIPERKPESEFVYRGRHKEQVEEKEEIDTYINKRFNNSHAWTPYLWERKR